MMKSSDEKSFLYNDSNNYNLKLYPSYVSFPTLHLIRSKPPSQIIWRKIWQLNFWDGALLTRFPKLSVFATKIKMFNVEKSFTS